MIEMDIATCHLAHLKDVLQAQRTLASMESRWSLGIIVNANRGSKDNSEDIWWVCFPVSCTRKCSGLD